MELPIDHFRLIGVSPSAQADGILRTLELRLDRPPSQGFTDEALIQRAELLRLSSDLLTNSKLRKDYEAALLGGASGLELSSNREVAGLILLWEADAAFEAFELACRSLQPPQAPALGSGREADLTLLAALSCQTAAKNEQELRHYEASAQILHDGVHLLQRMGKLQDFRQNLESELQALLPYRILDLLSRDIIDKSSHQKGILLLDTFVRERGGLEGGNIKNSFVKLEQREFELFFQQIRKFLTVQEQSDLFLRWHKAGSKDAGFLAVLAMVAGGYSYRKPDRIFEARKYLMTLNLKGVDTMPLLGCMDLLLADVEKAQERFSKSSDEGLGAWLNNYPGEQLGAICEYCRDWLRRDVLPGYRDVDYSKVDLESWFGDRDVQIFVEKLELKGARGIAKASFSFLSSLSTDKTSDQFLETEGEAELDSNETKDINNGETNESFNDRENEYRNVFEDYRLVKENISSFLANFIRFEFPKLSSAGFRPLILKSTYLIVCLIIFGSFVNILNVRNRRDDSKAVSQSGDIDSNELVDIDKKDSGLIEKESLTKGDDLANIDAYILSKPLTKVTPSTKEIKSLINSWLLNKSIILAGDKVSNFDDFASNKLIERVENQRVEDVKKGEKQIIKAIIQSIEIISITPKRIEAKTVIDYKDKRIASSGETLSETLIPNLTVTYILGREKSLWQLVAYITGN